MLKRILLATTALFLLFAGPANAGPLLGGIGALVGGLSSAAGLGSLAIGIASMGVQWLISKMLTPEPKQRGIKDKIEIGGDIPPTFVVGEYATPGHLVYRNTLDKGSNIPEACLVDVICLGVLPYESVSAKVFINNEGCHMDVGGPTYNGFYSIEEYVKGGDDGGYCLMKIHHGDQTNADSWLLDKFGGDDDRPWSNDMFLPGCTYVIVQSWYSNKGIWSGWPTFRFVVQGIKLYDPRKDTSVGGSGSHRWDNPNTYEFTKNPKVIEYNIIRGIWWDGKHQWGGKADAYRLPLEYWFAAMNACDENVTKKNDDIINRYEIGAEISFGDKPIEIINEINKSCNGYTTEFGGTYKTWVGAPGLSVATITDDDFIITEDKETSRFQTQQQTFNTCYTTYPEPRQQWEVNDGPRYQDHDALDEDGEELPLDLALPFVSENNQAQRLARAAIKDSRRQLTHTGQLPPIAWLYEPFDRITYISDDFGYGEDGKAFMLASKDDMPNVNQLVTLREINSDDLGWLTAYELDNEADDLVVVKPDALSLDVEVFADHVESAAGKDKPAIRAEWDWGDIPNGEIGVRHIDWRIRRSGATKVIARGKIDKVGSGEALITSAVLRFGKAYEIQFEPIPFANRDSVETDWLPVTMTAVEVPTGLTLTSLSRLDKTGKLDFFVKAVWNAVPQDDEGYGVKITIDGDTEHKKSDDTSFKFPIKAPGSASVQVRARAGDGGTKGAYCDAITINVTKKNTAPTAPTELTVVGKHRRAVIKTEDHPDDDFRRWCVYYSKTNSFGTATKSRHSRSNRFDVDDLDNGDTYYFWLTAEDTSGNESAKYPSSSTAGVAATMAKIDDDDTEDSALAAPTGLTLTKVQDTDEDGKIQTFIKMTCTAPGWATAKTTYVYSITVGSDEYTKKSDDTTAQFRVQKTGVLHTVKVRAIKGHGNKGSWSGNQTITPSKKSTGAGTGAGLTAADRPKGIRLRWNRCIDVDYKETIVYRHTANVFGSATEIDRINGTTLLDSDSLVAGTVYYYWIAHSTTSDVLGTQSSSANATWRKIDDDDTDDSTLAAPTGLTLTKVQDTDEDGKIQTYVKMACTAPAWATAKTTYVFAVTVGSDTYNVKSDDETARYRVNKTGVLHTVKVRGVKGNGNKGSFSSNVTITPSKKAAGPTSVTGFTVKSKPAGNRLKWNPCPDEDYKETIVYRNTTNNFATATEVGRVTGNRYLDQDDNLVEGTTYHYWPDHVNFSQIAASAAGTPATDNDPFALIAGADTETITLGAPTSVSQTQLNKDVDLDGTVDIAIQSTFGGGVAGAGGYEFELSRSTTAGGTYTVVETKISLTGKVWFKASTQFYYKTRCRALSWNNLPGTWSSLTSALQPTGITGAPAAPSNFTVSETSLGILAVMDAQTENDYSNTEYALRTSAGTPNTSDIFATDSGYRSRIFLPPVPPVGTGLYIYARNKNTSGVASSWVLGGGSPIAPHGGVKTLNIGTTPDTINAPFSLTGTLVLLTFKCTSNTAGVTINLGADSWTVDFVDKQPMSFHTFDSGGGSVAFTKSGGGTFANGRMTAVAI